MAADRRCAESSNLELLGFDCPECAEREFGEAQRQEREPDVLRPRTGLTSRASLRRDAHPFHAGGPPVLTVIDGLPAARTRTGVSEPFLRWTANRSSSQWVAREAGLTSSS